MDDDSKEIIYIALSNSLIQFKSLLESESNKEERELIEYIIHRHLELIDKYESEILKEKPISKPPW